MYPHVLVRPSFDLIAVPYIMKYYSYPCIDCERRLSRSLGYKV
jgi:hypothetical protein